VLSVNELAYSIVEEMLDYRDEYEEECKVSFQMLDNGAWVIDCGVNVALTSERIAPLWRA